MFILVSIQHTQVPLLQGDAVDHDEVVQIMLGCCCSYWDPSTLEDGVSWRGENNETEGRNERMGGKGREDKGMKDKRCKNRND